MSVLIKGMEMPKNCGECPMVCEFDLCHITKGGRTLSERPPHCPLIEVPKHGRLIDADAILGKINAIISAHPDEADLYEQDAVIVRDWLRSEPTVIERERQTN